METISSTALRNNPKSVYAQAEKKPVMINRRGDLFTLSKYKVHIPVEQVQKIKRAMVALNLEVSDSLDMTQSEYDECVDKIIRAVPIINGGW